MVESSRKHERMICLSKNASPDRLVLFVLTLDRSTPVPQQSGKSVPSLPLHGMTISLITVSENGRRTYSSR